MPFIKSVEIRASEDDLGGGHPFDVPAIASMVAKRSVLRFDRGMTVFVGDNGSGKSTLLEAVAVHQGLNAEGGARGMQFDTTERSVSSLHRHLRVNRTARQPRDAFFLRAESYFNVATAIDNYGTASTTAGHHTNDPTASRSSIWSSTGSRPNSLFLLDEPEAALSVHGQLQLLVRIHDLIDQGCQFIVVTHSPLLMAYPDATIYEFGADGPTSTTWSQIDTVHITTDFLNDPTGFLAELLAEDDD